MNYSDFISSIDSSSTRGIDRAVAVLWYARRAHEIQGLTTREVASILEHDCGHPRQNATRLETQLKADKRVVRYGASGWRLHPKAMVSLDDDYGVRVDQFNKNTINIKDIIPIEVIQQTRRNYLVRVVEQVNESYRCGLYDCTAVMARRLLENLIIEVYEGKGRSSEIKQKNGYFLSFEDLIIYASKDSTLNLSRETTKALAETKRLGDQCAHNRRFSARHGDIDNLKQGLRIAAEELVHLCGFSAS